MAAAYVQEIATYSNGTSINTHVVTISTAPDGASHLILGMEIGGGRNITSVTDDRGNTWQIDRNQQCTTSMSVGVASTNQDVAPLQVGDTVTVVWSGTGRASGAIHEVSGLDPTDWFDVAASAAATTTTTVVDSGLTATTSQDDIFLFAAVGLVSSSRLFTPEVVSPVWTAGTETASTGSAVRKMTPLWRVVATAGTYKIAGTINSTGAANDAVIVAYKAAASTSGGTANPGTPTLTAEAQQPIVAGVIHALDHFSRTETDNIGTPDTGPDWTGMDDPTIWSVDGSKLVATLPDATQANATIGEGVPTVVNARARTKVRFTSLPIGGFHIVRLYTRRQADVAETAIRHNLRVSSAGDITVQNEQEDANTPTVLTTASWTATGITVAANEWLWIEGETEGSYPTAAVRTRVWKDGDPYPASPVLNDVTATVGLDVGGSTGVWTQASTSGSQTFPVIIEWDSIALIDLDGNPPAGGDATASPGTATGSIAVLAATASGAAHVSTALSSVSLAVLAATASGAGRATPGTPALTAAVLAANASGAALASPTTPALTSAVLAATASGAAIASPGTPALTIAALGAAAQGDAVNYATAGQGATASASTTWQAPYLASAAIDEDDATAWASSTEPTGNWLRVDLGVARAITAYRLLQSTTQGFNSSNHAATWDVQYSDNDTDWTTATSQASYVVDTGLVVFGDVGSHRYWRVLATSDTVSGGWTVSSFELWAGATASAGTANPGIASATAAVLAATATGAAQASPAVATLTAAALAATATGQAIASPGTPALAVAALAASATGAASAQPGAATATAAALAATASGAALAQPGLAELTIAALHATANGGTSIPGTANPGTASATAAVLAASATGEAVASPSSAAATIAAQAVTATGAAEANANTPAATVSVQSATATGAAIAQPGTPTLSLSATAAVASGAAVAQPGSAPLTIEALHATVTAGGSAVAQPGIAQATAAVLAAQATGAAQVTTTRPALTISVLPATAHGSASAQPGTPALSTSAVAATATGAGRAQPGAAALSVAVLPSSATAAALINAGLATLSVEALHASASGGTSIPATASPGTPALSIAAFATTASGAARASAGPAAASVEVIPATATAAAHVSAGLAQATVTVLPASASGAGRAIAGLPALTVRALPIGGAGGGLPGGPISAVTRSAEYAHAFTRSLLRDYAFTNSLDSLAAMTESLTALAAITFPRDGMAGSTESEED